MKCYQRKNPFISFIIPAFNVENYLGDCIQSITSYPNDDIEVIIVDDGSTDATTMLSDEYSMEDSRVKVIHTQNGGQAAARNVGIKQAIGDYLWFIDSDDFLAAGSIDLAMAVLKSIPELDGVVFDLCHVDEHETMIPTVDKSDWNRHIGSKTITIDERGKEILSACTTVYNRERLVMHKCYFDTSFLLYEDAAFFLHWRTYAKRIIKIDQPVYAYRMRSTSMTHIHADEQYQKKRVICLTKLAELCQNYSKEFQDVLYAEKGCAWKNEALNIMPTISDRAFVFSNFLHLSRLFRGSSIIGPIKAKNSIYEALVFWTFYFYHRIKKR